MLLRYVAAHYVNVKKRGITYRMSCRYKCAEATEEGRGQCRYYSSQDVTNLIHIRAVSNQLMDVGRVGVFVCCDSESVDV